MANKTTMFSLTRDINGFNGFGLPFAFDNFNALLAQNVAQTFTIPGNFQWWVAIMTYPSGGSVWVANNVSAVIPSGNFSSTQSQLNPVARLVQAGDVLSFVTADTADVVNVALYALNYFGT